MTTPRLASRARGVTLVELLVVLVLLGIMAGVVGLTLHTATPVPAPDAIGARITAARESAVRLGHAVTIEAVALPAPLEATALPDGRVIADSGLEVDLLTGAHHVAH